jgi:hypothetical protein
MTGLEYLQLSQKTLQDTEALLARGDYHQASEKFWGAASVRELLDELGSVVAA